MTREIKEASEQQTGVEKVMQQFIDDAGENACFILPMIESETWMLIESLFTDLGKKGLSSLDQIISLYIQYKNNAKIDSKTMEKYQCIIDKIDAVINFGMNIKQIVPAYNAYKKYIEKTLYRD